MRRRDEALGAMGGDVELGDVQILEGDGRRPEAGYGPEQVGRIHFALTFCNRPRFVNPQIALPEDAVQENTAVPPPADAAEPQPAAEPAGTPPRVTTMQQKCKAKAPGAGTAEGGGLWKE
jgi:hypothetical protein